MREQERLQQAHVRAQEQQHIQFHRLCGRPMDAPTLHRLTAEAHQAWYKLMQDQAMEAHTLVRSFHHQFLLARDDLMRQMKKEEAIKRKTEHLKSKTECLACVRNAQNTANMNDMNARNTANGTREKEARNARTDNKRTAAEAAAGQGTKHSHGTKHGQGTTNSQDSKRSQVTSHGHREAGVRAEMHTTESHTTERQTAAPEHTAAAEDVAKGAARAASAEVKMVVSGAQGLEDTHVHEVQEMPEMQEVQEVRASADGDVHAVQQDAAKVEQALHSGIRSVHPRLLPQGSCAGRGGSMVEATVCSTAELGASVAAAGQMKPAKPRRSAFLPPCGSKSWAKSLASQSTSLPSPATRTSEPRHGHVQHASVHPPDSPVPSPPLSAVPAPQPLAPTAADLDTDVRASGRAGRVAQEAAADGEAVSAAEESVLAAGGRCRGGEAGGQAGAESSGGQRQKAAGEPRRKLIPASADALEQNVAGIRSALCQDARSCERACNRLHTLLATTATLDNRHAARIAEADVIPPIIVAMRKLSANRGVVHSGLDTLHQFAKSGCGDAVAEAGGADAIGEAMDAFVEDAELQACSPMSPPGLSSVPPHV